MKIVECISNGEVVQGSAVDCPTLDVSQMTPDMNVVVQQVYRKQIPAESFGYHNRQTLQLPAESQALGYGLPFRGIIVRKLVSARSPAVLVEAEPADFPQADSLAEISQASRPEGPPQRIAVPLGIILLRVDFPPSPEHPIGGQCFVGSYFNFHYREPSPAPHAVSAFRSLFATAWPRSYMDWRFGTAVPSANQ